MDSKGNHPLTWLAVALSAVAVIAFVAIFGLIYGVQWLVSQPMAFNNPAYMAVIVAGALIVGFGMASGAVILHDAVDAWGDALKSKAKEPQAEPMDLDAQHRVAQIAERMALARKYDRDGVIAPRPSYADDTLPPWPAQENGGAHPQEFTGG